MAFPCWSTCFLYCTCKDTLLGYSCCIRDLYVGSDVLQKLKSHGSNDLQRERFRGRCCWPQSSCGLSNKAAVWLLMGKLGAECLMGLLRRTAASLSLPHDPRFSRLVWKFRWPHVNRTSIFCCKNTTNAGNRTNPFMNHVLHLGRRLTFCPFGGVCARFIIVSVLAEAGAKWGRGWLVFISESDISVWDVLCR